MKPQNINKQISEKIDNLKYTDFAEVLGKTNKVSDDITISWKIVIPDPPPNTSKETFKELRYLAHLTKNISIKQKELVEIVDVESLDLFRPILKKRGLDMDVETFNKIWAIADPVIMNLKAQYNRPRPAHLGPFFGLDIKVIETDTHHTAAYPSGHTTYAAMAALFLSDLYPDLSDQFFQQVGMAGYARILQGVHYPSDNRAAMIVSGAIWEDIRSNFLPNNKGD